MQVMCADIVKNEVATGGCRTRFESKEDAVRENLDLKSKDGIVVRHRCPVCDAVLREDYERLFEGK